MFVSLERPLPDKHVSLMARNLAGEADYQPGRFHFDSERSRVQTAVSAVNQDLAFRSHKLFGIVFNQFDWAGTSGWEIWSDNTVHLLVFALAVARRLDQPLNVHADIMERILVAASVSGIKVDFDFSKPLSEPHPGDETEHLEKAIGNGEYFVITDAVIPEEVRQLLAEHA